jgi:transcriptional regulator with XRE-family HTH domain
VNDRELGRRIAYWRRRRGMTQVIFADRLGRSKSWLVKVEGGARSAGRLAILDLICEVLRIDLSTLLGEEPGRSAEICLDNAEVARIQAALERYSLSSSDDSQPDSVALRRQTDHAWAAFEFADYDVVSLVLPALIENAQQAYALLGDESTARLLIEVYQITASTLRKLGEYSLAWLAGDRGMMLARQNGDVAAVAATGFRIANAFLSMGRSVQAQALNISLVEDLQPELSGEANRALYGHVLLQAAVAAAAHGDQSDVRDLTNEATSVARHVSPANNHHHLAFCQTNVLLHEVGALLALGEGGRAVEVANSIDEGGVRALRRERRAAFLVDIARAHGQAGNRDDAMRNLLQAETVASREVRCRPLVQATIADLLRRSKTTPPLALAQLAERSGVHV